MEEVEKAYAAGLIDGEGTIGCYFNRSPNSYAIGYSFQIVVSVINTDIRMLEWLHERFGGYVYQHNKESEKRKAAWKWDLHGKEVKGFLETIMPYLVIKCDQAKYAIMAAETIGEKFVEVSDRNIIKRMVITERLRELKK